MPQSPRCLTFFYCASDAFFRRSFRFTFFPFLLLLLFALLWHRRRRRRSGSWSLSMVAGASCGDLTNIRCRHKGQNRDTNRLHKKKNKNTKCRYHVQLVFNLIFFFGFVFSPSSSTTSFANAFRSDDAVSYVFFFCRSLCVFWFDGHSAP